MRLYICAGLLELLLVTKVANHVVCLMGLTDFTNQYLDITGKEILFITFVILSQISCGKVQNLSHILSAQACVIVSPGFVASFQITLNN